MSAPILLALAIVTEVAGTVALRASDGLSRPLPTVIVVIGYGLSFWLLALVLKDLSVGLTYAVWAAAGTALIATIGILAYDEAATPLKLASLALIIVGVVGLNLAEGH
jgi:small multidrug resistance pump